MKSILYIGAACMLGAGIYGFVDYKKKERSREFQSLYREEQKKLQEPAPAVVAPAVVTAPVLTVKVEMAAEEKKRVTAGKEVVKKKKRKISGEQFSRAALIEEEIPLVEQEKKVEP